MSVGKRRHPMYEGLALLADPLYGYIQFTVPIDGVPEERTEKDIIDTPWLQRLRRVHQLQSSFWVFPSGEHSRFQHSLGTMHMAGRFADRLYPSLKQHFRHCPSQAYVKELLRLTGLVHDVGHGPFSHFYDTNFLEPLYHATHEGIGQRIVLGKLSGLVRAVRRSPDAPLDKDEAIQPEQVAYLIAGTPVDDREPPPWLQTLRPVFSGLYTADNMDYIQRDAYMTGFSLDMVDIDRLLHYTFVTRKGLTLHKSGSSALRRFVNARFTMYADVYFHRTNRAMDLHMQEVFEETVKLLFPFNPLEDLDRYLAVSDWSLLEGVRQWGEDSDPRKRALAEEWGRILLREVKWKMAYDHTETMDEPRGKKFLSAEELEAAIRAQLPPELRDVPFRVDMARQDPRPLNPLTEERKKVFIYDPATEEVSPHPVEDLFRYIPAQVAHYRVFALDHAHDADFAAAARAALDASGPAFQTNL
ncbi:MAG TPA: HD domain-containing protein [Candidatus Sulfotelmatobacter sp.]|nr:HD domain-containing protein [Candidatus Sulfotelmatobacter sp.]